MKKSFEYVLYDRHGDFAFNLTFVQLPAEISLILEEWHVSGNYI